MGCGTISGRGSRASCPDGWGTWEEQPQLTTRPNNNRGSGSDPGYQRPVVVVQGELFNRLALATVVVCTLTSTMTMARHPGNVALHKGEAGLDRPSVAVVTGLFTLDRALLGASIGALSPRRLESFRLGIRLVLGDDEAADRLL